MMKTVEPGRRLLLVDDDEVFREVLAAALTRRGFTVQAEADVAGALAWLQAHHCTDAVVDLRLEASSGLHLIAQLARQQQVARILMLTGYASVATAVEAIKLGATHYLRKPASLDDIIDALDRVGGDSSAPIIDEAKPSDQRQWEHLQQVLAQHERHRLLGRSGGADPLVEPEPVPGKR